MIDSCLLQPANLLNSAQIIRALLRELPAAHRTPGGRWEALRLGTIQTFRRGAQPPPLPSAKSTAKTKKLRVISREDLQTMSGVEARRDLDV